MPLNKQPFSINFSQGLNTKSDPWQVPAGQFLALSNTIFGTGGLLQKRNGYSSLTILPDALSQYITTFNGNLTAIGTSLRAFSQSNSTWVSKGAIQSLDLDVMPIVRSSTNQTQADSAISESGLICTVYTDVNAGVSTRRYTITDKNTGQVIVNPTTIVPSSGTLTGSPRVFVLGNYFIIAYSNIITATNHLEYQAISINNPTSVGAATNITSSYTPAVSVAWDGAVSNNSLYFAWNGADGGGAIRMAYLSSTLVLSSPKIFSGRTCTIMSVCGDSTQSTPNIWASFYTTAGTEGWVLAVDGSMNTLLAPTQIISSGTIPNITATAQNRILTVVYETANTYTYDSSITTDFLTKNTVTLAGVVGTPAVLLRSVGLASKAFLIDTTMYMLTAYYSLYQPTYFLIDSTGNVMSKLAYANGGGYVVTGLPSVNVSDTTASMAYLFKDLITAVNKTQGAANSTGVYTQTGVNLAMFDITSEGINTSEIGGDLHLTGGFLWMYDGETPVEHNFHLWPDNVETGLLTGGGSMTPQQYYYQALYQWTDAAGNLFQSAPSIPVGALPVAASNHTFDDTDVNTGTDQITVTGHGYSTGTSFTLTTSGTLPTPLALATTYYVIAVNSNTIQVATSLVNAQSNTAINISVAGSGTNTIHVLTNQNSVTVNVPTLRLTYKISNPVKIAIFRWSTAQQTYYQVTSITSPTLNNTAVDYITFTDTQADTSIIGNSILYTTGGVVEDIAAPACLDLTLFKSRLFLIDAENKNLVWYSKQVIQGTCVEMSDLFTIYVAPTIGAQGSTGNLTALSSMDDKLILFKRDAMYYLTGTGPDNTGANNDFSEPVFITGTVGCTNPHSIVLTPDGLMFQSDKGIWLLNRNLNTEYIGAPVEQFNNALVNSALTVPGTNQVRFTLSSGITLMYDYYYKQWGTFTNVPAIGSTLYEGLHTYINSFGQVLQETPGSYLDAAVPVLMSFTTAWFNMAGLQGYERAYFFYLLGNYITPHFLSVQIAYDYNPSPSQQVLITPDNYSLPYGEDPIYGDGDPYGGSAATEQWRIFFETQKCQSFRLAITESFDSSFGTTPGAGLTISGLNCIIGLKKGFRPIKSANSIG